MQFACKTTPFKYLRLPDVLAETGLSKSQLYRLVQIGQFPRPIKLSERCAGWRSDLVEQWKLERAGLITRMQDA